MTHGTSSNEGSPPNGQEATEGITGLGVGWSPDCHQSLLTYAGLPPPRTHLVAAELCPPPDFRSAHVKRHSSRSWTPCLLPQWHHSQSLQSTACSRDTVHQGILPEGNQRSERSRSQPRIPLRNSLQQWFSTGNKCTAQETFDDV